MKFFLSLLLASLLLAGCEKSLENFRENPVTVSDTIWATLNTATLEVNQLQTQLSHSIVVDSFSLSAGASLQTSNGLQVDIPANAFAGTTTGKALAEMCFTQRKGDLIRLGKPTKSNSSVLQSAGTFYINITKNGQSLSLQSGTNLRLSITDSTPVTALKPFIGDAPAANSFTIFNWRQADSSSLSTIPFGYQLISNRQGWFCIAKELDTVAQRSRVVLSMPAVYTNLNTMAFIVFKDAPSVVQLPPDASRRIWLIDNIPAGKRVIYVTLTKKGNDYWLGTQEMTTAFNQNVHVIPQKTSVQAISNLLDSL